MNFNDESTKIKLWLSLGFMKSNKNKTKDIKEMFCKEFSFSGMQKKVYEGMINVDVEKKLERKTIQIYNTINKVERCILEEEILEEDSIEEDDYNSEDDKEEDLLKEYR